MSTGLSSYKKSIDDYRSPMKSSIMSNYLVESPASYPVFNDGDESSLYGKGSVPLVATSPSKFLTPKVKESINEEST